MVYGVLGRRGGGTLLVWREVPQTGAMGPLQSRPQYAKQGLFPLLVAKISIDTPRKLSYNRSLAVGCGSSSSASSLPPLILLLLLLLLFLLLPVLPELVLYSE